MGSNVFFAMRGVVSKEVMDASVPRKDEAIERLEMDNVECRLRHNDVNNDGGNNDEVMELLPPTQGFFYGSDEIDEYYKETIDETIRFLEKEIPLCTEDDEFEYYASW
jgi:hypothetical protein